MHLNRLRHIKSSTLTILLAIYYFLALNFTVNSRLLDIHATSEGLSLLFWATVPVFFIAAFTILFNIFTIKYITKPFFTFLILTSAAVNYGSYKFGVIFDNDMMMNIFETTPAEAGSYANPGLFLMLFLTGIVPVIWLWWVKIDYRRLPFEIVAKIILFIGAAGIIWLISAFYYKDYASLYRNNKAIGKEIVPTYYVGSTYKYIRNQYFKKPLPYTIIGENAERVPEENKYLVVFMIGETARSQNYQANGYHRPTNAYTQKIDNVFSLRDVSSCGTATALSLPCMFSFMGREEYSREKFDAQDNLVEVLERSGIKSIWVDNDKGCKGICDNIENYNAEKLFPSGCTGEDCTDQGFIDIFDDMVKKLDGQDGALFFHIIGSHGPTYYKRYPRDHAQFQPDCQTSDLQKCSDEEIINAYDNTILYTDYIMAQLIEKLKTYNNQYKTALIYVSDHGESLGENGLYLHGTPYAFAPEEQRKVPFMFWISEGMQNHKKVDTSCLKAKETQGGFSHDNLASTLLNFMDIDTTAYHPEFDLLRSCMHEYDE